MFSVLAVDLRGSLSNIPLVRRIVTSSAVGLKKSLATKLCKPIHGRWREFLVDMSCVLASHVMPPGYDNIDLKACEAKSVVAMNTPGQNANAVAELVFGMILGSRFLRCSMLLYVVPSQLGKLTWHGTCMEHAYHGQMARLCFPSKASANSTHHYPPPCRMIVSARNNFDGTSGFELVNREIAFYGFGAVARAVHKLAVGFGMKSFAYDPYIPAEKIKVYNCKNRRHQMACFSFWKEMVLNMLEPLVDS